MDINFSQLTRWLLEQGWVVPVVGGAACGLAFLVGRRLLSPRPPEPPNDPVALFDAHFLGGVSKDRRAAPRRKGNTVEVRLSAAAADQEAVRGWILDRSIGGLCILVDHPVSVGLHLKVRPNQASEVTPWTDVTVRFCRQEGSQYELGCQFHRTPNWAMLLQFG
jgi:hypothetical protein